MTEASMIKVITLTSDTTYPGFAKLILSLQKFKWDYVVIETAWRGFGTKILETYYYLKENPQIEYFIFCDANDVVALSDEKEFLDKLGDRHQTIFSAERGCWPDGDLSEHYKIQEEHGFNFLNSGLFYLSANSFIEIVENDMPAYETYDQRWWTHQYLFKTTGIILDNEQKLFNSHSFIKEGDYAYENNRVQVLNSEPVFVHFNGRSVDEKFDQLIKI